MKNVSTLFFALLIASLLVGCVTDPSENTQEATDRTSQNTTSHPVSSENHSSEDDVKEPTGATVDAPSEKTIQADLLTALAKENQLVTLTNAELIKSLTDEEHYSATMSVTAKSKYADWRYEAEMSYTKYDQGWMVDDITWNSGHYTVVRTPEPEDMEEYVCNYRDESEIADYSYASYMIPMHNTSISSESYDTTSDPIITCFWDGIGQWQHAVANYFFTSQWEYSPQTDGWKLCVSELTTHGYQLTASRQIAPNYSLDFSGTWEDIYQENYKFSASMRIDIRNFSWEEFDAELVWDTINIFDMELAGTATASGHFTRIETFEVSEIFFPYISGCHTVFSCGDSAYIAFTFEEEYTCIHYVAYGAYGNLEVRVYSSLPALG